VSDEQPVSNAVENFSEELRAWRERLGLSQADLGTRMGYSGSHVSSVETMNRTPTLEFAKKCDAAMETPGTFVRLHGQINREAFPPWFTPFVQFEERAARIHNWDQRCLTGLLQTPDYARAIITSGRPDLSAEDVERDVAARMERQQILDRDEPPFCWFVIGEAALRTPFGGPEVMQRQLIRLAEHARRPRITLQVFPFASSDCPGSEGPVTIFNFGDSPSVGYAEGYQAGRIIEASADMARLVMMFDHLRAGALTPADSARFIENCVRSDHGE
jgi:transcriptional regulator with XRE-family HTH domain